MKYQCNKCNRILDIKKNPKQLDIFNRCIITANCRGEMFIVKNIIGKIDNSFYDEWVQRKQIYDFDQNIPQNIWTIKHNLNDYVSIVVYTYDKNNNLIKSLEETADGYVILSTDKQMVKIKFTKECIGKVQCIVTNRTLEKNTKTISSSYKKVSVGNILTVAIHSHFHDDNPSLPPMKIMSGISENDFNYGLSLDTSSAWRNNGTVFIYGNTFNVYSIRIKTTIADSLYSLNTIVDSANVNQILSYILLSNSNDPIDRIYNKIIRIDDLEYGNNIIKNNELLCSPNLIKDCYPNIVVSPSVVVESIVPVTTISTSTTTTTSSTTTTTTIATTTTTSITPTTSTTTISTTASPGPQPPVLVYFVRISRPDMPGAFDVLGAYDANVSVANSVFTGIARVLHNGTYTDEFITVRLVSGNTYSGVINSDNTPITITGTLGIV